MRLELAVGLENRVLPDALESSFAFDGEDKIRPDEMLVTRTPSCTHIQGCVLDGVLEVRSFQLE